MEDRRCKTYNDSSDQCFSERVNKLEKRECEVLSSKQQHCLLKKNKINISRCELRSEKRSEIKLLYLKKYTSTLSTGSLN